MPKETKERSSMVVVMWRIDRVKWIWRLLWGLLLCSGVSGVLLLWMNRERERMKRSQVLALYVKRSSVMEVVL